MYFNPNKVRGLMAEHGYNQTEVATAINRSEMTLRNKLTGKTKFTADEIAVLAKLFAVSPNIFFTNEFSYKENNKEKSA